MQFFERTEQGQYAAYDASSPLPRKLRSLLKVIDGKTSTQVYISSLESFGDVPKLLTSLQMAGLIRVASANNGTNTNTNTNVFPAEDVTHASVEKKPGFLARLRSSKDDFDASTAFLPPRTQLQSVLPRPDDYQDYPARASRSMDADERMISGAQRRSALARCTDEMSSFVLAHVPAQAFGILKELEDVADLDQLAIILGGYEQMIAQAGEPAKQHVAHIKQIMRENW